MAFIDNSGDIILDAVLTDLGRQRLAEGRFQISKFALGDEEINYALYDPTDSRGSSHYDLKILQTPILEAFTSDQSLMKSKLITLSRDNILYMPILKVNNKANSPQVRPHPDLDGGFYLLADKTTAEKNDTRVGTHKHGILHGVPGHFAETTTHIDIDQGIDSTDNGLNIAVMLDSSLKETSFMVKVDERLLTLDAFMETGRSESLIPRFVDDDGIATYYVTMGGAAGDSAILTDRDSRFTYRTRNDIDTGKTQAELDIIGNKEMFGGPLGNVLRIAPRASQRIQQASTLFDVLGTTVSGGTPFVLTNNTSDNMTSYKFIDTTMNVTGVTTGYSIDVHIRIIKGTF
tara:strand:- start:21637 stop:22674 length:1038 start_codon:yes stop_codon:yes gene_type:complete